MLSSVAAMEPRSRAGVQAVCANAVPAIGCPVMVVD